MTTSGREKSDAEDYRYFPEPDLVPVAPSREWVETLRGSLPEPPRERRARLQADWGFSELEMRDTVGAGALPLVEQTIAAGASPQSARKWWLSELARRANEQGVELSALPITPEDVARIQALVDEGAINDKLARQVFDGVLAGEGTPTRSSLPAASRSSPTRALSAMRSTGPSRPTPTWRPRSATARWPPRGLSSAR